MLFADMKNYIIATLIFLLLSSLAGNYYQYTKMLRYKIAITSAQAVANDNQNDINKLQVKLKKEQLANDELNKRRLQEPLSEDCDDNKHYLLKSALNFTRGNQYALHD